MLPSCHRFSSLMLRYGHCQNTLIIETLSCCSLCYSSIKSVYVYVQVPLTWEDVSTLKANCSAASYPPPNNNDTCSSLPWTSAYISNSTANCNVSVYTGSVCRQQLLAWQECAVGRLEDVVLDLAFMQQSQEESERDVAQFLHFLRELLFCFYACCM